ncbi:ATP-binding cassette domain-containing protein [Polluticaenibacter yanchengensis]|uniref:ATP-binding cassette domain-containing protein n=1 Tax=Polluticaenibacter yanchengensis TaxID=3014562 RepID=A0ABT4UP93_9BACT|nr:ATP-binding cassette domain-containing protein [Chitinophagaceae bacterium LY-5]
MNIQLNQLIPIPLKEKILQGSSDIWNNNVVISKGDYLKIVAPSGTGKTTLTHILWKLRTDYTGEVQYDGCNINGINAQVMASFRQQKLSVIFQDLRLFGHLTAIENIELSRIKSATPGVGAHEVLEMAETLGVSHILNQKANTCSYGEQQRVAIIRSLVQPFEILVMDEPFSHLDENNTLKAAGLIEKVCKQNNAGFVLMDLDEDSYFEYTHSLKL